jgi:hypothetical protein
MIAGSVPTVTLAPQGPDAKAHGCRLDDGQHKVGVGNGPTIPTF